MKKIIFGAIATLMISGSALAGTNSNLVNTTTTNELKTLDMQRYCVVRVTTTQGGTSTTQTFVYPVDSNPDSNVLANAQCQALKALHMTSSVY